MNYLSTVFNCTSRHKLVYNLPFSTMTFIGAPVFHFKLLLKAKINAYRKV